MSLLFPSLPPCCLLWPWDCPGSLFPLPAFLALSSSQLALSLALSWLLGCLVSSIPPPPQGQPSIVPVLLKVLFLLVCLFSPHLPSEQLYLSFLCNLAPPRHPKSAQGGTRPNHTYFTGRTCCQDKYSRPPTQPKPTARMGPWVASYQ